MVYNIADVSISNMHSRFIKVAEVGVQTTTSARERKRIYW